MIALGFDRRGGVEYLIPAESRCRDHVGDDGTALGQRPGLVEHDGIGLGETFERITVADENPERRGAAAADHHRHRRGQAHRARAGYQQHRQCTQNRRVVVAAGEPPDHERPGREHEHGWHKDPAHPVSQPLQRRLVPLSFLDQPLQAGQHRLRGQRPDPHDERAPAVMRAARDHVAGTTVNRHRLTGKHRFINRRPSADDGPVERDHLMRPYPYQSPEGHAFRGDHVAPEAVRMRDNPRGGRPQRQQRSHRPGCPAARTALGRASAHENGHDKRRHSEVQPGRERASAAADVDMAASECYHLDGLHGDGGECPEGGQGIHVHRAVAKQASGIAEKRPASGEFHDNGQDEDGPSGTRRLRQEQRHEQRGYRQRPGDDRPQPPAVALLPTRRRRGFVDGLGRIADVGDGSADLANADRGAVVADERPGRGQVGRRARDGRQPAERTLDPHRARTAVHAAERQLNGSETRLTCLRQRHMIGGSRQHPATLLSIIGPRWPLSRYIRNRTRRRIRRTIRARTSNLASFFAPFGPRDRQRFPANTIRAARATSAAPT